MGAQGRQLRGGGALLSPEGQAAVIQETRGLTLRAKGWVWTDVEGNKSKGILGTAAGWYSHGQVGSEDHAGDVSGGQTRKQQQLPCLEHFVCSKPILHTHTASFHFERPC